MRWDDLQFERTPYSAVQAYNQSKLANVLFSSELARRTEGSGVTTYCLHPGVVATDLARHLVDTFGPVLGRLLALAKPLLKTVESGAQTSIHCAVEEAVGGHTGRYYSDCGEARPAVQAQDAEDAGRLWQVSEKITGLRQEDSRVTQQPHLHKQGDSNKEHYANNKEDSNKEHYVNNKEDSNKQANSRQQGDSNTLGRADAHVVYMDYYEYLTK